MKELCSFSYANAFALGIYNATLRVKCREGGYPSFEEIRNKIIQNYGLKIE